MTSLAMTEPPAGQVGAAVGLGGLTTVFGEEDLRPEDLPGFDDLWAAQAGGARFASMGCGTIHRMARPIVDELARAVDAILAPSGARGVDALILATSDRVLPQLPPDLAAQLVTRTGLAPCVPMLVSYQQCCSSLAALRIARDLVRGGSAERVVVLAFDFTSDDRDRVTPFAIFSDAVAGCVVESADACDIVAIDFAVGLDGPGLCGDDSIQSRQETARGVLGPLLARSGLSVADLTAVVPCSLYTPVTTFNAMAAGLRPGQLVFARALEQHGHCGNCDWLINLSDYATSARSGASGYVLAQATAPGFYSAALLRAAGRDIGH